MIYTALEVDVIPFRRVRIRVRVRVRVRVAILLLVKILSLKK
jgi:hypothetical protein